MATVNESLRDEAITHSVWISRYATGVANRMVKLLNETDAELSARLLDALDRLPADSFTVTRLESLLGSVRELNHQAVASMQSGLEGELLALSRNEVSYQLSLFDSLLPSQVLARYPLQGITADMVYAAAMAQPFQGRLLSEWADNLESDRLARIVNAVRRGYLAGDTVETIARSVRGHANKDYRDGALQMSRANAASIAKTAVNHLAATARNSFTSANSDIVKGKQWLSTLDNKTSHDCIIRDLLRYTLDNKPIGHKVPYLQGPGKIHFCCRSTETLILKSWRELGIDIDEMDDGTRASMDGQVPAKTTYLEWLRRQSAQRQDQVLGVERGRMFRAGKIDLDEMYTDKGEWISLEQLQERSGAAPTLESSRTLDELVEWMTGRVAQEVKFPDGVSLDEAKQAAQAAFDVIHRFGLQPVSAFGNTLDVPASAAGAYESSSRTVHLSRWAMDSGEWENILKNSAGIDMTMMVRPSVASSTLSQDVLDVSPAELPYVAVASVKGTVWHELGHHLYYSQPEVGALVESAYDEGWWRALSAYAAEAPKELFAEIVSAFMSGQNDTINPEILKWLKQHSRS